jgi:hypothetical protein
MSEVGSNPALGAPSRHVHLAAVSGLHLGVATGRRNAAEESVPDGGLDGRGTKFSLSRSLRRLRMRQGARNLLWSFHFVRDNDACATPGGAILHVDLRESGFGQPGPMILLRMRLPPVIDAEKHQVHSDGGCGR